MSGLPFLNPLYKSEVRIWQSETDREPVLFLCINYMEV